MCVRKDICDDTTMTSVTSETRDFLSRDSRESPRHNDSVVMEFTSHPEDDVIKRIPVLGPTRKQTELFFLGKQDKPCTADPIKRHHRDNNRDTHTHDATSGNRPSSSYNAFNPQQTSNSLWLKQPARPPKHSPALTRPTIQQGSKSVSMVTTNSTRSTNLQSYDAASKQSNNSLLTHWPNSGYDTPPRYCVINSIGNNNNNNSHHQQINSLSREPTSTALRKSGSPVKDLINSKPTHSFVITADTSSLLVKSKSPFKPSPTTSAVGSRARAKSAIQKVSEANHKSIVKSRSAQSRLLRHRSKQHTSDNNLHTSSHTTKVYEQPHSTLLTLPVNTDNTSHTTQDSVNYADGNRSLSPASSNYYLQRYCSDTSLQPKNQRKIRSGTTKHDQSSPQVVPVENCEQSFLVVQRASTQLSFSKPHTPPKELVSSPMAGRRKNDTSSNNGVSLPGNKQTQTSKKGKDKTLTPSKHGYHPRSNSPTFKRLLAAVERLNETSIGKSPSCQPTFRSVDDGSGDSASTDSHSGYRNFKDCYALNDVIDSDFTESDGNSRHSDLRINSKASRNSRKEESRCSKNSKISSKSKRFSSETREPRDTKPAKSSHDQRAIRNSSLTRERDFPPDDIVLPPTGLITSEDLDAELRAYESNPPKEPETRVQEGQPTQLHFFLPQLADSMSEVSGATMTSRSFYQDQRLELLARNDTSNAQNLTGQDQNPTQNGSISRGRNQNGSGDANPSKCSRGSNPSFDKSSVGVKYLPKQKHSHYPGQLNGHGDKPQLINGNGDRCLSRDFRGGSWNQSSSSDRQSPNKEDPNGKHKRYISPARNKNCNITDKGARRKQLVNGNNNSNNNSSSNNNHNNGNSTVFAKPAVSYSHDFLDGQLPSEKLKKQIDNFPTLVSMEYSESPTPQQVR